MENNNLIPRHLKNKLISQRTDELLGIINDFYGIGGLNSPIQTVTDLFQEIFTSLDPEPDENGNYIHRYKTIQEPYLTDMVFMTTQILKFFANLNEQFNLIKNLKE